MKTILYPLERPNQLTAMPLLRNLAASGNAEIRLVESYGDGPEAETLARELRRGGVSAQVQSAENLNLAETIRDLGRQDDVELTVVTSSQEPTVVDRVLGETASDLIDDCATDLLVATTPQGEQAAGFRNVLVPIDFSDASRRSLGRAASWVESGGTVTLLYVIPDSFPLFNGARGYDGDYFDRETLDEKWKSDLDKLWSELGRPDTHPELVRAEGDWESCVIETARESGSDLVVVGETGGIARGLAERLAVATTPCPVLIARRPTDDVH